MSPFRGFVRHMSPMSAWISILFSQTDLTYTHRRNPISTDAQLHDHIPIILALQIRAKDRPVGY